jgi:CBS domain-containing protein
MTKVSEVMTSKPQTVSADDDIDECMQLMREAGFRHLPVMDGTKLLGLVSLRDIMMRPRKSAGNA